ncbi:hypothetical protein Hanom_Chr00s005806g01730691 [Helianthus anomalus]
MVVSPKRFRRSWSLGFIFLPNYTYSIQTTMAEVGGFKFQIYTTMRKERWW